MSRAALITGGAKRVGAAISRAFAAAGYDIVMHYNSTHPEELADELRASGVKVETLQADLSDPNQVQALIERAASILPHLSVLVNSAAIFEDGDLSGVTADSLDRHMAINLRAPMLLTRDYAAYLDSAAGLRVSAPSVVNILDTRLSGHDSSHAAYSLSKKALEYMTVLAAVEFAPRLRVNGVAPGLILPPPGKDQAYLDELAERVPLQTHGEPADVARAALYLAGEAFVTGQTIYVDGGQHL